MKALLIVVIENCGAFFHNDLNFPATIKHSNQRGPFLRVRDLSGNILVYGYMLHVVQWMLLYSSIRKLTILCVNISIIPF